MHKYLMLAAFGTSRFENAGGAELEAPFRSLKGEKKVHVNTPVVPPALWSEFLLCPS